MTELHLEGIETEIDIDDLVTARDAAILLRIDPAQIRKWASRNQIDQHLADDGSPRYLLRDVLHRERATRALRLARQKKNPMSH